MTEESYIAAVELANNYRSQFFKYPKGIKAFKEVTPVDALAMTIENCDIADSFHFEQCLKCKANNFDLKIPEVKLTLKSQKGGYYFVCEGCLNRNTRSFS